MAGKVMETVIQISGVMSDSVKQAVGKVNAQLGLIDKKSMATATKFAAIGSAAAATAGGIAVAMIKGGNEYIRTMNDVSAQTGITGDELKGLGEIIQDVYASGKGESLQQVADSLVNIRQASGLAGEELKNATNAAMLLNDTFGMETAETTRAATALMKNFGVSAEEAYGIIAVGAQNGANKNGDLLDTLNEYSVHYKALGLNAEQFVTSLIKGAEAGSFSIDKVGDAVKEFTIRSKDGSDTTAEGFAAIGLDAETMTAAFAAGGDAAQAAFFQTVKALNAMEDPVAKNAAGVALFGTMFEDLEAGVLSTMAGMSDANVDAAAALRQMEAVKYNDIGYAITQIGRSFEVALIPGMEQAGQAVYQNMPEIQANVEKLTPAVTTLGVTFAAALPVVIGFLADGANEAAYFAGVITDNWGVIGPIAYGVAGAVGAIKLAGLAKDAYTATAAIKATTVALTLKSRAAMIDKAETLYLQALYAKDAAIRGASTAATWSQTAATRALGFATKSLLGPVGLAIAAGVLLYENWDTVQAYAVALGSYISTTWDSISTSCAAMGSSVTGVFTTTFTAIPGILAAPVNGAIGLINSAITSINSIGVTIPDWVPGVGGQSFSPNIPSIPMLAKGGFTQGLSFAGEAGQEAVISFDPAYRKDNIGYLQQAAARLGIGDELNVGYYADRLAHLNEGSLSAGGVSITYNLGGLVFSPTVTINGGNTTKESVIEQLRNYHGELLELIEELLQEKEAGNYGTGGVF